MLPIGSCPIAIRRSETSGILSTSTISRDSRSTMGLGVPAGRYAPPQTGISNPGKPCSAKVASSGQATKRLGPVIPRGRTFPAAARGFAIRMLTQATSSVPFITSVVACTSPL